MIPCGIVPDNLELKKVAHGMWAVINPYKGKYDFFARSPLFDKKREK